MANGNKEVLVLSLRMTQKMRVSVFRCKRRGEMTRYESLVLEIAPIRVSPSTLSNLDSAGLIQPLAYFLLSTTTF